MDIRKARPQVWTEAAEQILVTDRLKPGTIFNVLGLLHARIPVTPHVCERTHILYTRIGPDPFKSICITLNRLRTIDKDLFGDGRPFTEADLVNKFQRLLPPTTDTYDTCDYE